MDLATTTEAHSHRNAGTRSLPLKRFAPMPDIAPRPLQTNRENNDYFGQHYKVDRAVAQSNARQDWEKDNAGCGATMTYERFLASMFELVSQTRGARKA